MKNYIKNSIVLVVLFTTILTNANDTFVLRNLNDNKTTMLTLLDVKQGNLLLIKDANGFVLFKENITNSGAFTKGFNFTTLPDGKYFFELKKGMEIEKISFMVKKKLVELKNKKVSASKQATEIKPVEFEKGVERRIPSFKGGNFIEYYKSN